MAELNLNIERFDIKCDGKTVFVIEDVYAEFVKIQRKKEEMAKSDTPFPEFIEWYMNEIKSRYNVLLGIGEAEELIFQIENEWVKKNRKRAENLSLVQ